ncbi:MAG: plastocyanin/azurin family copper-binding protein [bacterium]|nr:plastocyanin/azurin family copper-binding protein [bacterium]
MNNTIGAAIAVLILITIGGWWFTSSSPVPTPELAQPTTESFPVGPNGPQVTETPTPVATPTPPVVTPPTPVSKTPAPAPVIQTPPPAPVPVVQTPPPAPAPAPVTQTPPPAPTVTSIAIASFAYSPATITVKKGTTVKWTNNDSAPHTVTGINGGPASGTLNNGQTYSYTFNSTGSFNYGCAFHGGMFATVNVTE